MTAASQFQPSRETVQVRWHDLSDAFADAAMLNPSVAVDSETTGLDWRSAELRLVQVRVPGIGTELVRLRPDSESTKFTELLDSPSTTKIFHHAMFDLGFMHARWGSTARAVACTKVASKLLWPGDQERQSLRALTREHLGVELDKAEQASDWSAHELRPEQVIYAATDVRYLHDLFGILGHLLRERELWEIAQGCWEHIPFRVQLEAMRIPDPFLY